jgi:deazaflavin-dependent oxidoreductase (nitroreductase family)
MEESISLSPSTRLRGIYMAERNVNDWNSQIIAEFHANGGKVGGPFEGGNLLLLTTTGAKSGQQRINPLAYFSEGGRLFIFASKAGAPTNPDWYYNLLAHPIARVEVGTEEFQVKAVVVENEEEREQIYAKQVQIAPGFGDYERKTTRKIPVIELVRNEG